MSHIVETHAFNRNIALWSCFLISLYNSLVYSQENIHETSVTLYIGQLMFIGYISWDAYKIFAYKELYRGDLVIHHAMCLTLYLPALVIPALKIGALNVLPESLSLMNYWLANNPTLLLRYKLAIILFHRMPFWFIYMYYAVQSEELATIWWIFTYGPIAFIMYDLYVFRRILLNRQLWKN